MMLHSSQHKLGQLVWYVPCDDWKKAKRLAILLVKPKKTLGLLKSYIDPSKTDPHAML